MRRGPDRKQRHDEQKEERQSLVVARADAAEFQKRLGEERMRLRLAVEAQTREQASLDAARLYDTKDFVHEVGQRNQSQHNRWVAMQRVLLLSRALPDASLKSLSRDWGKWDSVNRNDGYEYPSPESYAIQYKNWIRMLLAHLADGNGAAVRRWWMKEIAKKVPDPADVILPSLPSDLLTGATHLVGAPPAPP